MSSVKRRLILAASALFAASSAAMLIASRKADWPGSVKPYEGPGLAAAEPTAADPAAWAARWDDDIGLWWQHHPGHTPRVAKLAHVHPAPAAAARLLLAAQSRQLAAVDVAAVLRALRRMQVNDDNDGSMRGCMRWYWEEHWPKDQNASFFTALSLIALDRCYADQFDDDQRALLREILAELHLFFTHEAAERRFVYPNRCLGDLVCAWLIGESLAGDEPLDPDGKLRRTMLDAAEYWSSRNWGWGEHLSDTYADVCLEELSMLLLLGKRLPQDVREKYKALFDELLALDDAFGGKPRVPALRSYAFTDPPRHTSFRDRVCPLPAAAGTPLAPPAEPAMPPEVGGVFRHTPPLGATLHQLGWHELAGPRTAVARDVHVPCIDGIVATARIEPDVRLGSISRYPLSPGHDARTWGNAWQAFPVSMWRPTGEWGFLQWESRRGDKRRAQPALDIVSAYHEPTLTSASGPLITGQTCTIQRGGDVIALRIIPSIAREWDSLSDRFRLVNAQAQVMTPLAGDDGGQIQLVLHDGQRRIGVACVPLSPGATVARNDTTTAGGGRIIDWGPAYSRESLGKLKSVAVLWAISLDGPPGAAPVIRPLPSSPARPAGEQPLEIEWHWPNTTWRLKIDPQAEHPLTDLSAATTRPS